MLRILTGSSKPRCVAAFCFLPVKQCRKKNNCPAKKLPASPRYSQFAVGERYGTSTTETHNRKMKKSQKKNLTPVNGRLMKYR